MADVTGVNEIEHAMRQHDASPGFLEASHLSAELGQRPHLPLADVHAGLYARSK